MLKNFSSSQSYSQNDCRPPLLCDHCGEIILNDGIFEPQFKNNFCCAGCQSVFTYINAQGLDYIYKLSKDWGESLPSQKNREEGQKRQDLNIFDQENLWRDFGHFDQEKNEITLHFYLEGVTCYACVWAINKLQDLHPEIEKLDFNPHHFSLALTVKCGTLFSPILLTLEKLGHRARFLESFEKIQDWQINEERELLKKLAVSGASFGNIMLLSISDYAGAEAHWKIIFSYISLIISLPSVFYSGQYFFISSWNALKNKSINIDTPLALAILVGFLGSLFNIVRGEGHQYLDSVTGLIFLILITRYILRVNSRHSFKSNQVKPFFENGSVKIFDPAKKEYLNIFYKHLRPGMQVKVASGQIIPCDGELFSEVAYLNLSFLSGEPEVKKILKADTVLSGSINSGPEFDLKAKKTGSDTALAQIFNKIEKNNCAKSSSTIADRLSKYIISVILLMGASVFIYFVAQGQMEVGLSRLLSLFIVTCPCALALASPMAMSRGLKMLLKKGILIKSENVLEKFSEIENIFLDKTGTVTEGKFEITQTKELIPSPYSYSWKDLINQMESFSQHPIALALFKFTSPKNICPPKILLQGHREIIGEGVEAYDQYKNKFFIGDYQNSEEKKCLALYQNDQPVFLIYLEDSLKKEIPEIIKKLKNILKINSKEGKIFILSGDRQKTVDQVAQEIGIDATCALGNLGPKEKEMFLKKFPNSVMIGDGVNDSLALKSAGIGIAVSGSMEASLKASDIYFSKKGLEQLLYLFFIAKKMKTIIKRNIFISICYNSVAATLALFGIIGPLSASLVMPAASLTALFSTLLEPLNNLSGNDL